MDLKRLGCSKYLVFRSGNNRDWLRLGHTLTSISEPVNEMTFQAIHDVIEARRIRAVMTLAESAVEWFTDAFEQICQFLDLDECGGEFFFKSPKSEASRRTVSAPTFLVEELAEHLGAFPDPSGLIFTAPTGGPIRRTNFRRRIWMPAVDVSVGEPCTFHDLRHSHAALLISQGEHPKVIQERLGHASIKTTLDTYGHLFDGLDEAAADRLDATWQASRVNARATRRQAEVIELPNS